MLNRIVGQAWVAEEEKEVHVSAEAVDADEVALHAHGHSSGQISLYVSREEAVTLGVMLIAAAHSSAA